MTRRAVEALGREGTRKMAVVERQAIERELQEIIDDLSGRQQEGEGSRPDLMQEKGRLLSRKKAIEEQLNRDDDLKANSGAERDRLVGEIKELEHRIKNGLPTEREQAVRSVNSSDYERAVQKTVAHQRSRGNDIRKWQELKRRLEPDNPMADDVGLLQR